MEEKVRLAYIIATIVAITVIVTSIAPNVLFATPSPTIESPSTITETITTTITGTWTPTVTGEPTPIPGYYCDIEFRVETLWDSIRVFTLERSSCNVLAEGTPHAEWSKYPELRISVEKYFIRGYVKDLDGNTICYADSPAFTPDSDGSETLYFIVRELKGGARYKFVLYMFAYNDVTGEWKLVDTEELIVKI